MIQKNKSFVKSRKSFKSEAQLPDELSDYSEGRLIVKTSKPLITDKAVSVINGYRDLWIIQYSSPEEAKESADYYKSLDSVEYAEPDRAVSIGLQEPKSENEVSEETKEYLCWGSYACGFDVANQYLKSFNHLNEVKVGVIDTGIDLEHPFLKDRLLDEGRNFSTSGDDTCNSDDEKSHGTHVAGIIVDNTPDEVRIKGYKIFSSDKTTTESICATAIYAAVEDSMQVLNMSFGGLKTDTFKASLDYAFQSGVTLVSAAGNSDSLINILPAMYENGITVGALDYSYSVAGFSNHGDSLDLLAPGVSIYSSLNQNSFGNKRGTSMATPYVTAGVALLICKDGNLLPSQIEKRLKDAADNWFSNPKFSGAGLMNISEAVGAPTAQKATVNYESALYNCPILLEFEVPENTRVFYTLDNSAPITTNPACIEYKEPFVVQQTTRLKWCSYSIQPNIYRSQIGFREFRFLFAEPESLFTVTDEGVLTSYMGSNKDIKVPERINGINVRAVGSEAFSHDNASEVSSVYFPPSVEIIKERAFFQNKKLLFVSAPGVQVIGIDAFYKCSALEEIETPNLQRIESDAFNGAKLLNKIELRKVEYVGEGAFFGNQMLVEINMDSLTSLGEKCFGQTMIERAYFPVLESFCADDLSSTSSAFAYNQDLTEVSMPNLLTLGEAEYKTDGAFSECSRLRKVYMPKLKTITVGAFYKCTDLNDVCFDSAEIIERDAFYGCLLFESVILPKATRIESNAFMVCNVTEKLSLPSAEIISSNAFDGSVINCIYLDNIIKLDSLPWNDCSVIIGSTLTSVGFYGNINPYHYTVYGTSSTYAEEWATSNHSNYSTEFIPVPELLSSLPDSICSGESISLDAIGFNLTYQWYGVSDDGEYVITGEVESNYCPSGKDNFKSYYCRITSDDHGIVSTFDTDQIPFIFIEADYSTLDEILSTIPEDLSIYTDESVAMLKEIINSIDRNLDVSDQETVDEYVEAVSNAIAALKLKEHTVSFIVDNESILSYELEYGSEINDIPDDPEKAGYTFTGWSPGIPDTMPNESMTFTAEFEPITYYVSFMVDGEEIEKVPFTVESKSISEPEIPVKEGYTGKWSEYIIAASDITVNAEYTINEYKVSFVADDKTVKSETVKYGSAIEIPDNPQKEGYIFKEWLPKVPETMPAKDMTFYAVFEEVKQPDDNPPVVVNPSVDIRNFAYTSTVDYRTTITFTAITKDIPKDSTVVWYIDGQKSGEGERFIVKEAREAFTVQAKIVDKKGNVLNDSETELVKVKADFFSKIIAFFRMLFGMLPVIEQ